MRRSHVDDSDVSLLSRRETSHFVLHIPYASAIDRCEPQHVPLMEGDGRDLFPSRQRRRVRSRTLKRWMRLPEFETEYLLVRREAMSQANARIQHNSSALVSLGLKLVSDASVKAHLILGLLDRGNKSLELQDALIRVAALERVAEITKSSRN
jgi:hypothetical protein